MEAAVEMQATRGMELTSACKALLMKRCLFPLLLPLPQQLHVMHT
jgi:hypothetical protein